MAGRGGFMQVLEWTADGTYPTRGIVCPEGVFLGQYRQKPTAPAGREGWEAFSLPLSETGAACYRIVGTERVADGPADALVVEELAWWQGALYAAGWSLDADGYCHPCLWRRAAEDDWDLLWTVETDRRARWDAPQGLRLYATSRVLFLRGPGSIGSSLGLAYTGVAFDCGQFEWAGEVDGSPWVVTAVPPSDDRLSRLGALVLPWADAWRERMEWDGWRRSEFCAWRGHLWILLSRYDLVNLRQTVRLAWVTTSGDMVTRWEAVLDLDPAPVWEDPGDGAGPPSLEHTAPALAGSATVLRGRIGNRFGGYSAQPADVLVAFDGQVVVVQPVTGRALGIYGHALFADRAQPEAWMVEDVDHALYDIGGSRRPYMEPARYALCKTPVDLCLYGLSAEWADGTGGAGADGPQLAALALEWSVDPATDWDHEPRANEVSAEWSDGSGGATPTVPLAEIDWGDGSGTEEPTVGAASIEWDNGDEPGGATVGPTLALTSAEWADSAPAIDPDTEKVLWLLEEGERLCSRLRVTLGSLTPAQQAQCRVYVRTDGEHLDVDAWHTYQVAALRRNVFLERPGYTVRIGIVGPDGLPVPDVQVEMVRD